MYNGHRNWNHWNVSLWLFNDEGLYGCVCEAVAETGTLDAAARLLVDAYLPAQTMDGAPFTFTSVRAALVGWED